MLASFNAPEAVGLLSRLAPPPGHFLELRFIEPDSPPPRQEYYRKPDAMLAGIGVRHGRANVYVGAAPRCRQSGKKSDVAVVVGVWADVDFHQIEDNRSRAETIALERLARFPLQPTMVVHTGNGLQAWWLFHSNAPLNDACPADRIEAINRGLQLRLGGDAVWDIARVLRVPGTLNLPNEKKRARGCVPVMARLLDASGPNYEIEHFAGIEVYEKPTPGKGPARPAPQPRSDLELIRAFQRLLDRLGPHHPLVRTWRGERQLRDSTRSAWDMALANQLARLRIREEIAAAVLRANPLGRREDGRDDYIDRTLAKAYARYCDGA
jgi:hypothetical protein